jgi:hypothetical protein
MITSKAYGDENTRQKGRLESIPSKTMNDDYREKLMKSNEQKV